MKKVKYLFIVFAIVGVMFSFSVNDVKAGAVPVPFPCPEDFDDCDAGQGCEECCGDLILQVHCHEVCEGEPKGECMPGCNRARIRCFFECLVDKCELGRGGGERF